jgi:hypothetical protein
LKSLDLDLCLTRVSNKTIKELTQCELVYLIGSKETQMTNFYFKKLMLNNEIKKKTIRQKLKEDVGPHQLLKPVTRGY